MTPPLNGKLPFIYGIFSIKSEGSTVCVALLTVEGDEQKSALDVKTGPLMILDEERQLLR